MRTVKYGATIRKLVEKATAAAKTRYECPKCHKKKVVRKGMAIWKCKSCDAVFAGGAYSLTTEVGEVAARLINEYSKTYR
jgi:ribosomal protein eL43